MRVANRILKIGLLAISVATVYLVWMLNLIYCAEVSYNAYEQVTITERVFAGHFALLAILVLLVLWTVCKRTLCRIRPLYVFLFLALLYVGMAIYLIFHVGSQIRADASWLYYVANGYLKGDFSQFAPGGYIDRYPHQTGFLLVDTVLLLLFKTPRANFILNFLFVLGINALLAALAHTMCKRREVTLLTILMAFSFLPQFFFILFAYGLIPGFFFTVLAFYLAVRFLQTKRVSCAVFAITSVSIAVFLKQNFLIGAIAIVLYWLLQTLCERGRSLIKPIAAVLALLLFVSVPSELAKLYYEKKTGADLSGGTPAVLWIAMGTDLDNTSRAPGWYDHTNYTTYEDANYNTERAAELGVRRLRKNLKKIKKDPERAGIFFKEKIISLWCEPMFQSVWTGPLEDCGQKTRTALLKSIYTGGEAEDRIEHGMRVLLLAIFGFALLFLLARKKEVNGWELLILFFIGGFLFHLFWEGKSQYTYPYVFVLIPMAAASIARTSEQLEKWFRSHIKRKPSEVEETSVTL